MTHPVWKFAVENPWRFILLFLFICGILCMQQGHEWGDDFALYLMQSKSILNGNLTDLYLENKWSMDASEASMGPYLYPPGLPVFLIPVIAILGMSFVGIKMWIWIVFVLSTAAFIAVLKKLEPEKINKNSVSVMAFLLAFINPKVVEYANRIGSDMLFTALVLLFFYILLCMPKGWKRTCLLIIFIFSASEVRMNGLFLLPVYWVDFILHYMRSKKEHLKNEKTISTELGIVTISTITVLFMVHRLLPQGNENHWMLLKQVEVSSIWKNILYYVQLIGKFHVHHLATAVGKIPALFLEISMLVFMVIGAFKTGKKAYVLWLWLGLNLAMVVVWPSQQGSRFIFPMIPFTGYFMARGIVVFADLLRLTRFRLNVAVAAFCTVQTLATVYHYQYTNTNEAFSRSAMDMYDYAKKNIPPSEIVSFHKPRLFYFQTGIKSIRTDTDTFFLQSNAKYKVVSVDEMARVNLNVVQLAFKNERFAVYRRTEY